MGGETTHCFPQSILHCLLSNGSHYCQTERLHFYASLTATCGHAIKFQPLSGKCESFVGHPESVLKKEVACSSSSHLFGYLLHRCDG